MKIIKPSGKRLDLNADIAILEPVILTKEIEPTELYILLGKMVLTLYNNGFEIEDEDLLNLLKHI